MEEIDQTGAAKWLLQLELGKKADEKWSSKGRKIVKRYRDERGDAKSGEEKYNILWSNVRTLQPAVYSKRPKAYVARRYKDRDPIARAACQMLQRAIQYELDYYNDFDSAMRNAVLDRLLPGRGVAWVRFEPHLADVPPEADEGVQVTDDTTEENHEGYECAPTDYVFWEDFRNGPARTWEEVPWVARRVYMTKEEGEKRFGDKWKDVPLSHQPIGLDSYRDGPYKSQVENLKKAKVWEIWDKTTSKVIWVAEGFQQVLDERDDPLGLEGFFPCPKPLYSTLTTDSLVPVPDYVQYQDQARELDLITNRISLLVKACKVVGVYAGDEKSIPRIFTEGTDNTLIPVDNWAMFAEKGGLKGMIDWVPLDQVSMCLEKLYLAREQVKQVIYEVTGISDILRGASQAQETLGAQQIKAQFASMRLEDMKKDVSRFASDIIRIKAQIICDLYRPETIIAMSGIMNTDDKQYAQQALALIKQEPLRNFRIEVAADSMVELDEMSERNDRMEFLKAAAAFLQQAIPAAQTVPEIGPLVGEMLMFAVRSWKTAEPIEEAFDQAVAKLNEPKPPAPPPPEVIKAQADAQTAQINAQVAQVKAQSETVKAQAEVQKAQAEIAKSQMEAQGQSAAEQAKAFMEAQLTMMEQQHTEKMEAARIQFEAWKTELQEATKIQIANMNAEVKMNDTAVQAANAEVSAEIQQQEVNNRAENDKASLKVAEKAAKAKEKGSE